MVGATSPFIYNLRSTDTPLLKSADFHQYLSRIGSRPRAFQRATYEVRTLPLTPPKVMLRYM